MAVSQSASCSSIDLAGVPARILEALAGLVAVCREPLASAPCAAAFEEAELRVRESVNALGCEVLGAWVEGLDDGALRVERGGQCWFRVPATAKTIMSTLGPVTYSRARYRHGAERASLVPVDEGLGLVNDYLTRPAARLGLMMVGHGTAREAEAFFSEMGAMRPACPCEGGGRVPCSGSLAACMSAGRPWSRRRWTRSATGRTSRPRRSAPRSRSTA